MRLEAPVTPIWKKQKLFVSLFILAFGAYFFWDGAIGYPAKNARYVEWKTRRDAGKNDEWVALAKERGWKEKEWTAYAEDHGWNEPYPDVALGPNKIAEQYYFGILCSVIGLGILGYWLHQKDRVLKLDDDAITSPAGVRVPFGAITGIGLKKWDSKGLAKVRYTIEGKAGEFEMDDYKFEPEPTRKMMDEIKARLAPAAESGDAPAKDEAPPA